MKNYSKVNRTNFSTAILVLLLSVLLMIMLSGCGSDTKYTISGRITSGGSALSGVEVTLSGDATRTALTDINGNYIFSDVSNGTYTVTPSLTGYTFVPQNRMVYLGGINATGFDFSVVGESSIGTSTHTVYLKNDGTVWTWGNNSNGQLGNGTTAGSAIPVQASGLAGVTAIAAGNGHSVALKSDGTLWAWGKNSNGQLGNGTTIGSAIPVQVSGLSGVMAVAAGGEFTVAMLKIRLDSTLWAWGKNSDGQLGNGTTTDSSLPVQISGLSGVIAIDGGNNHTVALKSDGTLWAWGNNSNGQLGNGTTTGSAIPVQINGLSGVMAIAAGNADTVAMTNDRTLWAWGNNLYGQLGDGTIIDRWTPVQIQSP